MKPKATKKSTEKFKKLKTLELLSDGSSMRSTLHCVETGEQFDFGCKKIELVIDAETGVNKMTIHCEYTPTAISFSGVNRKYPPTPSS